ALTVLMSLSRTAIAGMFAGFVIVALQRGVIVPWSAAALLLLAASLSIPEVSDYFLNLLMRGQSAEQFQSLTGRSEIYAVAIQRAGDSWFGEGHGSLRGR